MRLPSSLNDITIAQFQECYFINKADPELTGWAQIIAILSGRPLKEIEDLPTSTIKKLKARVSFVLNVDECKFRKYILVNKTIYKAIYEANKISTAQAIDLKTFLKPQEGMSHNDNVVENAHKLLASIYLPLTITGFKYDGSNHLKISEDFRHAKLGHVYGTLFFYSRSYEKLMECMLPYMNEAEKTITNHMEEVTRWANTETTGVGK